MRVPEFAGLGVTTAIVLTVDWPLDWLCALAVVCGAVATFAASSLWRVPPN